FGHVEFHGNGARESGSGRADLCEIECHAGWRQLAGNKSMRMLIIAHHGGKFARTAGPLRLALRACYFPRKRGQKGSGSNNSGDKRSTCGHWAVPFSVRIVQGSALTKRSASSAPVAAGAVRRYFTSHFPATMGNR